MTFIYFFPHLIHILSFFFFFFNDTATTEIYTLSLHDALPGACGRPQWSRVSILVALPAGDREPTNSCSSWWRLPKPLGTGSDATTGFLCGSFRSCACRRSRDCPDRVPPNSPGAAHRGIASCSARSPPASPRRSRGPLREWCITARPHSGKGPGALRPPARSASSWTPRNSGGPTVRVAEIDDVQ